MVGLDVAGADVQVADFAADGDDAAAEIVADMTADDVGLVLVHAVEEEADAAVAVEVALRDDDVAITLGEVDAVTALADGQSREGELHRAGGFDAVGLDVRADDLEPLDDGCSLGPGLWLERLRGSGASVCADDFQGWSGTCHDQ